MQDQDQEENNRQIPFSEVVEALLNNQQPFPAVMLPSFSDLSEENLAALQNIWLQIQPKRRASLLEDLDEIQDRDTLSDFSSLAQFALEDPLPQVRTQAIDMLWDWPQKLLARHFLRMLENDPDGNVRAAAATALGNYIYLGELDEFPSDLSVLIVETLVRVIKGKDEKSVRMRALESASFSSNEAVPLLIEAAYQDSDREWLISALFSMGRSGDEAWNSKVLSCLDHSVPEVQAEAVRAAGELEIQEARQPLIDMLEEYETLDDNVRIAAVVSLSRIGGEGVRQSLEAMLEEINDDEEAEIISAALENLDFVDLGLLPGMFDFSPVRPHEDDEDDLDYLDDWELDDENEEDWDLDNGAEEDE